jgi:hypothetical protein
MAGLNAGSCDCFFDNDFAFGKKDSHILDCNPPSAATGGKINTRSLYRLIGARWLTKRVSVAMGWVASAPKRTRLRCHSHQHTCFIESQFQPFVEASDNETP